MLHIQNATGGLLTPMVGTRGCALYALTSTSPLGFVLYVNHTPQWVEVTAIGLRTPLIL